MCPQRHSKQSPCQSPCPKTAKTSSISRPSNNKIPMTGACVKKKIKESARVEPRMSAQNKKMKKNKKKSRQSSRSYCSIDRAPSTFSSLSFFALAWANSDLGLILHTHTHTSQQPRHHHIFYQSPKEAPATYLLICLFLNALILAVQGLMMLSDGETYGLVL